MISNNQEHYVFLISCSDHKGISDYKTNKTNNKSFSCNSLRWLKWLENKLDITVKEGISRLAKITSNVIAIGEKRLVTVPRPDKACKELLKRVNVTLPEVLPYRETHVATRKKLNSFRKRK